MACRKRDEQQDKKWKKTEDNPIKNKQASMYTYDKTSKFWIEPLSLLLGTIFPVESVFAEWYKWQIRREGLYSQFSPAFSLTSDDIESGSQAEGFCIPELYLCNKEVSSVFHPANTTLHWIPDHDKMHVKSCFFESRENYLCNMFHVEHISDDQRYVKLRLTDAWKNDRSSFKNITYLSQVYLLPIHVRSHETYKSTRKFVEGIHGPANKRYSEGVKGLGTVEIDETNVFQYPIAWPEPAMEWLVRSRESWPSPELIQNIFESSCHIAPVGRSKLRNHPVGLLHYMKNPTELEIETEWRISFTIAENKLAESVSPTQRFIFVLFKTLKKAYFPSETISTYHLKNLFFWECEIMKDSFWRENKVSECLIHLMDKLIMHLERHSLPHYIIPCSNLFHAADPDCLDGAVKVVTSVKKDIMNKSISILKRLASLTYFTHEFISNLQLDQFLDEIKNEHSNTEQTSNLMLSMHSHFIVECKKMIDKKRKVFIRYEQVEKEKDEEIMNLLLLPIKLFESVLSRLLCGLWKQKYHAVEEEHVYLNFIKQQVEDMACKDEIVDMSKSYYQSLRQGNDILTAVPLVSQVFRNIYVRITKCQNDNTKDLINLFPAESDSMTQIGAKILKELQESKTLNSVSMDDINAMLNRELGKLFSGSGKSDEQ